MAYIDGFLLPAPIDKLPEYVKMSKQAGKIWLEHGALQYFECVGDDLEIDGMLSFNKVVKPKEGETVIFSFIVFKSRKHRDQVNKKVMSDPRLKCDPNNMPFDCKKMAYGGFKTIVEMWAKSE